MLEGGFGNSFIDHQTVSLARALSIEADPASGADQQRQKVGAGGHLGQQQYIEAPTLQCPAQVAPRRDAAALVEYNEFDVR